MVNSPNNGGFTRRVCIRRRGCKIAISTAQHNGVQSPHACCHGNASNLDNMMDEQQWQAAADGHMRCSLQLCAELSLDVSSVHCPLQMLPAAAAAVLLSRQRTDSMSAFHCQVAALRPAAEVGHWPLGSCCCCWVTVMLLLPGPSPATHRLVGLVDGLHCC